MTELKTTFCRICEPACSLIAECDDHGEVVQLLPDTNHPSGGVACHKGLSFLEVHNDPDRLDHPLKRINSRNEVRGEFVKVSWDEALGEVGGKLKALRDEFGPNSIGIYIGNPLAMANPMILPTMESFQHALGTQMTFNASTQDMANKLVVSGAVYGSMNSIMVPDLINTDYLLCIGSNPRVSRWTLVSKANDDLEVLKRMRARGGKIRFVNPRRTESSNEETGPTILIKPNADVYFLAALLHEIDLLGGFDEAAIAKYSKHVEHLRSFISCYPAEKVAEVTGVSAELIKQTAGEFLAAKSAVVYMSTGVNQGRQGVLAYWLGEMINFLTGNLGKVGGSYKPTGLIEMFPPTKGFTEIKTSLETFYLPDPASHCCLPCAKLGKLIESGDIRALIVLAGNPVLTIGGEESFREAIKKLDLLVVVDIYRQATGEMADYLLSGTDWLEHMDINLVSTGFQLFPYAQYTDAVVAPKAERRNSWWIMSSILQAMGLPSGLDANPMADDCYDIASFLLQARGLTIEAMRELPSNTAVFPQRSYEVLFEECVQHADKKIDCFPENFKTLGLFERCDRFFEDMRQEAPGSLKIIGLRTPYMHNSYFTNLSKFRRGKQTLNPLYMTEPDASARDLQDGDMVRVFNVSGSIEARVSIADDLRQGVCAMSHGYGHDKSFGVRTARKKPGSNVNAIMPIETDNIEPLSYMSWITGVPVNVERISPQASRADGIERVAFADALERI